MKMTARHDAEQEQKAVAGQMRSRPAGQQTIKPSGHLAQLVAMANAGPQTETLAQWQSDIQRSSPAQRLMGLAAQINQVSPAQLHGGSRPDVLQAVWVDDPESPYYTWESPEHGVIWHAHKAFPEKMFFLTTTESAKKMYGDLENQWKPRTEWVQLHGADPLKNEDPTPVPRSQIKKEHEEFEGYVDKGRERYGRLEMSRRELSPKTAKSRDEFFEKAYVNDQFGYRDKYDPEYPVNYKAVLRTQPWDNPKEKKGLYVNEFDLVRGRITADQNYADKANEVYVDKETGKPEVYNNSEVIYQQWKRAKKEIKNAQERLSVLRRAHVSGDGIPVVKAVWAWLSKNDSEFSPKKRYSFTNRDKGFYALLAAANCSAAIYLIADHGRELGIRDIRTIVLEPGDSIEIEFD